jgi:hypothetical protein
MIAVISVSLGVMSIPCRVDEDLKLATDKSPEDVRSELLQNGLALSPFARERAAEIEQFENGTKVTLSHPIFPSQSYTLETEARQDGSIAVYNDHVEEPTIIDFVSDQERTIVLKDISPRRANLIGTYREKFLMTPYKHEALRLQGYDILDNKKEYSIL